VYEASISLAFAGELDLPQAARVPDALRAPEARIPATGGSIVLAGQRVALARSDLRSPFTTEISGDRWTITFRARHIVREGAVEFALYAARRFSEKQGETPISMTPGSITAVGERDLAGAPTRRALVVGLIVFGFAIIAVAASSQAARRAIPAMLHILLG
jgi:hypothetical protein